MKENRLVVADSQWAQDLPEWILTEIQFERLTLGMASLLKPEMPSGEKVGDAEVCAYLFTAALRAPISGDMTDIYIFLCGRLMQRRKKEIPDFVQEQLDKGLTEWEQHELRDLKQHIYTARGGEIHHPVLEALKELKKDCARKKNVVQPAML